MVLGGIHGNVEMCRTEYNIPSKLIQKISPYSEVIIGNTTFKLTKHQRRFKEK